MMPLGERTGFIYEVNVKALTMLHPDVPEAQRGTLSALAHPAILAHLRRIGVDMVELMPITAWIDERHLPPLGLTNSWGYNPVAMMALDPRIVPGGVQELRNTVAALHAEGIGVILDLVFNHTGESDVLARRFRCAASTTAPSSAMWPMIPARWSTTPAAATRWPATIPLSAG